MVLNIKILGWKASGFRCPDHEINLEKSTNKPYNVSLIQMPNGTGKTTTLNLLQAALSGVATSWKKEEVKEFQKRDSLSNSAEFEIKLLLNDKFMTIIMHFDFEGGSVHYKTTYGSGQKDGFRPPREFDKFLSENFVKFYIFDGELADKLLSKDHGNAEDVIKNLFQLNVVDTLKTAIDKHWEKQTEKETSTEGRGLARAKNDLAMKQYKLKKYINEQNILQKEIDGYQKDLEGKENKFKEEIDKSEKYHIEFNGFNKELHQLEQQKSKLVSYILESMTDPYSLSISVANELHEFKDSLDRVQLPETAAREFFQELAEETECVCGRPIDDHIKSEILNRANQYLGSDDVSLLNSIKTSIEDSVGLSKTQAREDLSKEVENLNDVMSSIKDVQLDLESLKSDFQEGNPEIETIANEINEIKESIVNTNNDLQKYIDPLFEEFNIEKLRKGVEEDEKKVAIRTNTVSLNNKRKKLKEILSVAHREAKLNISSEITRETNEKIIQLMPHNHIRIEKIQRHIILEKQSGGSVGEQLSVAYAFLSTLFQRAE